MSTAENLCCPESPNDAGLSRRGFLRGAAGVAGAATVTTAFGGVLTQTAYGATTGGNVLVVLSMRGAADGLSLVVPHADPTYYAARPRIAIPANTLLRPDAQFGLNPTLAPLLPMWDRKQIAAIHATGLPVANRSHFAAMEEVENAAPGSAQRTGWLNRLVDTGRGEDQLRAVQYGPVATTTALSGPHPTLLANTVGDVRLTGNRATPEANRRASVEALWKGARDNKGVAVREALVAADKLGEARRRAARSNASTPGYPSGDLAEALQSTAQTIKADVGTQVVTVDHGNWDLHSGLAYPMFALSTEFARSTAAFFADLGDAGKKVTLVTISEFGRRITENANAGLDHGHGSVMFAMGAGVRGGYYAKWPSLENSLDADLKVTTDYRDVLGEIVDSRFPDSSVSKVFPGHRTNRVGFMR
jgi:uncharacterized protein (DUF1501 family)